MLKILINYPLEDGGSIIDKKYCFFTLDRSNILQKLYKNTKKLNFYSTLLFNTILFNILT